MARTFTSASSEKIDLALGAGASITGAVTLAAIVKKATDGVNGQFINIGTAAASARRFSITNTNVLQVRSNSANANGTTTVLSSDGWCFVAVTKAAGSATPRFHIYKYATNAWTHENGSASLGDSTPTTGSCIGYNGTAGYFNGDLAVTGAWASDMTDAQVEALAYSLTAWWQVQPNGLWVLDQGTTSQKVYDLTGNGANESSITGTSIATSAVPVFSYGAPIIVPTHPAPSITVAMTPAEITVTPQVFGLTPGTASVAMTPASVTVTPVALGVSPGTASVAMTPAELTVTPQALGVSPGTVSLAASPAELTVTPQAFGLTPGTASVALTPAELTVTPAELGIATVVATAPVRFATYTEHTAGTHTEQTVATHTEHTAATAKEL